MSKLLKLSPLIAVIALAQEPARALEEAPRPTGIEGQVAVHLVHLPLSATDRQGNPVRDLRAEEIRVKLRGRSMRVSHLDPVRRAPPAVDVRLFVDVPGGSIVPVGSGLAGSEYVVFFVDVDNDSVVRRDEAARAASEFVRTQLDPAMRAGVFAYDGTLHLDLPFTQDRDAVASAILSAFSRAGRSRLDPRTRMQRLVRKMETCVAAQSEFTKTPDPRCLRDLSNEYAGEVDPRAQDYLRALQEMVSFLSGLRGRKTVIALSHGVPIEAQETLVSAMRGVFGDSAAVAGLQGYAGFGASPRHQLDLLLDTLVRSRVSLSFVDRMPPPSGDFQASRGEMLAAGQSPMRAEYDATAADMAEAAAVSGGIHIQSTDLSKGIQKALSTLDGSYDLSLLLEQYVEAKSLAKVDVSCTRRGVKLVHSRGVYLPAPRQEPAMKGRFVLAKPSAPSDDRAPAVHQPLRIEIDPRAIGYAIHDDVAQATFTLHLTALSSTVELADSFHFVSHEYPAEVWKSGEMAPVTLIGWIEAPPGAYLLRAWIRNTTTEREGVISGQIVIAAVP